MAAENYEHFDAGEGRTFRSGETKTIGGMVTDPLSQIEVKYVTVNKTLRRKRWTKVKLLPC